MPLKNKVYRLSSTGYLYLQLFLNHPAAASRVRTATASATAAGVWLHGGAEEGAVGGGAAVEGARDVALPVSLPHDGRVALRAAAAPAAPAGKHETKDSV